jgi:hypothetical protein
VTIASNGHEHEFEPQPGLPERLPQTERMLWQGSPELGLVMRRVFHLPLVSLYFAVMLALKAADVQHTAGSFTEAVMMMAPSVLMTVMGLGTLAMLAWLTCRTTVYTLTDRRVVMRIGIVLTLTFNLPLSRIQSADLKAIDADRGDIALTLSGDDRIAWVHLWPHARPWRLTRPEPMLRAIPDVARVSSLLTQAWSQVKAEQSHVLAQPGAYSPSVAEHAVVPASIRRGPANHPDLSAAA